MWKMIAAVCMTMVLNCSGIVSKVSYFPLKTKQTEFQPLPDDIQNVIITTRDQKKLHCYYVNNPQSQKVIVYFHGNAGNMYQRIPELLRLSKMGIDVFGAEYRGYGKSTGRPSEKGLYRDGHAVLDFLQKEKNYCIDSIFIYGRSIGTTVAVDVCVQKPLGGVILVTPLTSGKMYAKEKGMGILNLFTGNPFDNIGKCRQIRTPVLIIHGTADEIIPYYMGKEMYDSIASEKYFVRIERGNHNNLEYVAPDKYWGSIEQFVKGVKIDNE